MWDAYSASLLFIAEAERVVGWARNHYLSSTVSPSIKGDKLIIPQERYFCFTWTIVLVGHFNLAAPLSFVLYEVWI
jgi:hypothetical protein